MRRTGLSIKNVLAALVLTLAGTPAPASTLWNWTYSATGITASGTFTTADIPDAAGGYLITGITGMRKGSSITGLQPAGTAIPGNEPYDMDNLVFLQQGQQLTKQASGSQRRTETLQIPSLLISCQYRRTLNSFLHLRSMMAGRAPGTPSFP